MATLFKINFKYTDFEPISETSESQLTGGFSSAISVLPGTPFAVEDNNCNGGNCTSGCGTGQNVSQCNTTMGCGKP
jgi:hypothetical protein